MFYYLYEVRNNLSGKIYVGVHKTKDLNDGYMGSGKVILAAIEKYGVENFTKTILEYFESKEAMYAREKEVVTEEFLARDDTYNLRRGGNGGFDWINKFPDLQNNRSLEASKKGGINSYLLHGEILRKTVSESNTRRWLHNRESMLNSVVLATKASQSEQAKLKRKETFKKIKFQQGERNSQYGTYWIHHDLFGNKKCKKDLLPYYIDQGWSKGKYKGLKHA